MMNECLQKQQEKKTQHNTKIQSILIMYIRRKSNLKTLNPDAGW